MLVLRIHTSITCVRLWSRVCLPYVHKQVCLRGMCCVSLLSVISTRQRHAARTPERLYLIICLVSLSVSV